MSKAEKRNGSGDTSGELRKPKAQATEALVDGDFRLVVEISPSRVDVKPVGGGKLMNEKPRHHGLTREAKSAMSRFEQARVTGYTLDV